MRHPLLFLGGLHFGTCLQVWLDASLPRGAGPDDPSLLPFPLDMQAVDLGPSINDALQIALPSTNLCGRPDCSIQCKHCFPLVQVLASELSSRHRNCIAARQDLGHTYELIW